MLEVHSALAGEAAYITSGLNIVEAPDFTLCQVAGFGKAFEKDLSANIGKLPARIGVALKHANATVMRVGPQQFWLITASAISDLPSSCLLTPMSSARCRIVVSGAQSRMLLSRCAAVNFDTAHFLAGHFVMTGIHHTPVLIHHVGVDTFHIYALRTFALNIWHWLVDAAEGIEP
jgi:heterotetrameric sarcosine oxidase gamma subunit